MSNLFNATEVMKSRQITPKEIPHETNSVRNMEMTKEKVAFFNSLPIVSSITQLFNITEERAYTLGFAISELPHQIINRKNEYIFLFKNGKRAEEYAKYNESLLATPELAYKASGNRSMLFFKDLEYTGQLFGTRFITAVNFKPFLNKGGLLIPKPFETPQGYKENEGKWKAVTVEDLIAFQQLSLQKIVIWNAISSPSSPYLHFQFVPEYISDGNKMIQLPLSNMVKEGKYSDYFVYFSDDIAMPCIVSTNAEKLLAQLKYLEVLNIPCDLLITRGKLIAIVKHPKKGVVTYPWKVNWRPTAERIGFIFFHPKMQQFADSPEQLIQQFWATNNNQLIDSSELKSVLTLFGN